MLTSIKALTTSLLLLQRARDIFIYKQIYLTDIQFCRSEQGLGAREIKRVVTKLYMYMHDSVFCCRVQGGERERDQKSGHEVALFGGVRGGLEEQENRYRRKLLER